MWHWIATAFSTYVLHPMRGNGYQWHSGIGSVYTPKDLVYGWGIWKVARHHNCHHKGCPSLRTARHPDHGWPLCKKHWNEVPEHIRADPETG